ncbi:hypothetical protein J7I98_28980 [Streptomyces sp. ISL-98]|nr:hypothetical protein [Streptomyces sp. ISL-98]
MVGQVLLVQEAQHVEGVRLYDGEHWVGGAVEDLQRGAVRAEVPVPGERGDGFLIGHQGARHFHLEVAVEVSYAVAAVEWAAHDVVHGESGLAVLDDRGQLGLEGGDLFGGEQGKRAASRCRHGGVLLGAGAGQGVSRWWRFAPYQVPKSRQVAAASSEVWTRFSTRRPSA